MSDDGEAASPEAERRLGEQLEPLRSRSDGPSTALVGRVVRSARWQRVIRTPLRVAGMIAGAVFDGLVRLVAPGKQRRR